MNGKYRRGLILCLAVFGCIGLVSLANGHEFLAANGVNDNKYCASIYFGTSTSNLGTGNGGGLTNFTVKNIAKPTLASTSTFVAGSTAAGGVLKFGSSTSNKGTATFTFATGLYISNVSVYAWSKSTAQTMTITTGADTAGKTINFTSSTTVPDLTESEDLPLTSKVPTGSVALAHASASTTMSLSINTGGSSYATYLAKIVLTLSNVQGWTGTVTNPDPAIKLSSSSLTMGVNSQNSSLSVSSYSNFSAEPTYSIDSGTDSSVATASINTASGLVTLNSLAKAGSSTFVVTGTNGTESATASFTVTVDDSLALLTLDKTSVTVNVDGADAVVAASSSGFTGTVSDEAVSSDTSIATASVSGSNITIHGVKAGSTNVSVTATNGTTRVSKIVAVTVNPTTNPTITLSASTFTLPLDRTIEQAVSLSISNFSATATLSIVGSNEESSLGSLSATTANNGDVVYVSLEGYYTGECTYTIAANAGSEHAEATLVVTVKNKASITLSDTELYMMEGSSAQTITATGQGFTGVPTWTASSDNTAVASTSVGNASISITPVAYGTATITVTGHTSIDGDITATCAVIVKHTPSLTLDTDAVTLTLGDSPLAVTYSTAYFSETPNVTCSNSSDAVCTVSQSGGVITITPVSAGSSTLTVSAHYYYFGNEDASVELPITIKASSTETEETGTYTLVTSSSQLVAGYNYIIASSKAAGDTYVSSELNSSYISVVAGAVTANGPDFQIATNAMTGVHSYKLGGDSSSGYTFEDLISSGTYLGVSVSGTKTSFASATDATASTSKWNLSFSSGAISMISKGDTNGLEVQFNSDRFKPYASGFGSIYLYYRVATTGASPKLSLSATSLSLLTDGTSSEITATTSDFASTVTYSYTSDASSTYLAVEQNANVFTLTPGSYSASKITVQISATDGATTRTANVYVRIAEPAEPTITLSPTGLTLEKAGSTGTIAVSCTDFSATPTVTLSGGNTAVATATMTGSGTSYSIALTAVGNGSCTFTISATAGTAYLTASLNVQVGSGTTPTSTSAYRIAPVKASGDSASVYNVTKQGDGTYKAVLAKTLSKTGTDYIEQADVAAYYEAFDTYPQNYRYGSNSTSAKAAAIKYGSNGRCAFNYTWGAYSGSNDYSVYCGKIIKGKVYNELDIGTPTTNSTYWSSSSINRGTYRIVAIPSTATTDYADSNWTSGYAPVCLYTPDHYGTFYEYYNYGSAFGTAFRGTSTGTTSASRVTPSTVTYTL